MILAIRPKDPRLAAFLTTVKGGLRPPKPPKGSVGAPWTTLGMTALMGRVQRDVALTQPGVFCNILCCFIEAENLKHCSDLFGVVHQYLSERSILTWKQGWVANQWRTSGSFACARLVMLFKEPAVCSWVLLRSSTRLCTYLGIFTHIHTIQYNKPDMCIGSAIITAWPVFWREPRQESEQICEAPVANDPTSHRSFLSAPQLLVPRISGVTMLSLATEGFKWIQGTAIPILQGAAMCLVVGLDGLFLQISGFGVTEVKSKFLDTEK